jgi:hypothetical protein
LVHETVAIVVALAATTDVPRVTAVMALTASSRAVRREADE